MAIQHWFRPPRHQLVLFLGTALVFLAGLGWLGLRQLQTTRELEEKHLHEQLEASTDLVALDIRKRLAEIDEDLGRLSVLPEPSLAEAASAYSQKIGGDALLVVFRRDTVEAYPRRRLLYHPDVPMPEEHPIQAFAAGELYEDRDRDFVRAIAYFEELAAASEDRIRAGALVRLARNQKAAGRPEAALATYSELARLGDVLADGRPAELVARRARCDLLRQLGRSADLVTEARALDGDLSRAQWQLPHAAYLHYAGEVQQWLASNGVQPASVGPGPVALSLAESVDYLWGLWQADRGTPDMLPQPRSLVKHERLMFLAWRDTPDRFVALVAGPGFLQDEVIAAMSGALERRRVAVVLADDEGKEVASYGRTGSPERHDRAMRARADTRLPWTLRVASADPAANPALGAMQRRLLLAGLGFVALLVGAGTYFSARAMAREIEAARLQSDFVAAVSHEFRTPLTLLRQFSDMLAEGRVSSEQDRMQYYAALQRGTRRLTRLVENLLDFGRMEAGSHAFRIELLPVREWITQVTSEFQEEFRGQGYQVDVAWEGPDDVRMRGDQTALGRALWNLLDNAVKYSPASKTIWVKGTFEHGHVTISVRDRGIGVPAGETRAIFGKFVRGSAPGSKVIKGTGLGLALVEQIVQAHGGTVGLESTEGEGSTFWISLPADV